MDLLEIVRTFWPIAVVIASATIALMPVWLRSFFPSKSDLAALEARLGAKIDHHDQRLHDGSGKLAMLDKRVEVVEADCRAAPSRHTLQVELSELAQRMRGVEVQCESVNRNMSTQNDYLHALIQQQIGKAGGR